LGGGQSFRIVLKKRNQRSHPGRRGYFENICLYEEGYCKIHEKGCVERTIVTCAILSRTAQEIRK
jgi:hypothetical protein